MEDVGGTTPAGPSPEEAEMHTTRFPHTCDHGFCTVCGGVWPCARAERAEQPPAVPVARWAPAALLV